MEGVSPLAVPAAFAWGGAAFILIAIDWSQVALGPTAVGDVEQLLIIGLSVVSLVLGGLAAMVHDDIEHVLGYSILQDAGIAVLAFASLSPDAAAAARDWLVASATVKTAFAAWAAVVRATYGGHRLADLSGWARHSPALGIAFVGMLAAAVGLPGFALWDARSSLISGSMPGFGPIVAVLVALMPLVYLGRIALAGIAPVSPAIAAGPSGWLRLSAGRADGWSAGSWLQGVRLLPAVVRANRAPLMALGVVALAAMALATSIGGAGGG
jgi:formate hydrogenlyase subunit 3/multisubunit Na+/H+ antiporter MnhD subunit